jgi:CubicO group peptidase (beta-lactamase class C family)
MERWLEPALEYVPAWLDLQMRQSRLPGCIVAVAERDKIVLERAFGFADLARGEKLTPRHRFRIASHSKSFTAAGIMKLHEAGKLHLDDPVGGFVPRLHPRTAAATIAQVLSHTAGLTRDGADAGFYDDSRAWPTAAEMMAELAKPPVIDANTRFKYSNYGYALLGAVITAITGEPYYQWIRREIVDAARLRETLPDMPLPRGTPFARGHTPSLLLGERLVIPGDYAEGAAAPAGGFVSTAADLARWFAQLMPEAKASVLSVASRREMIRRHWRNPHASAEQYYGFGIGSGMVGGWEWFGHGGGLQGYISRTSVVPAHGLTVAVLTNATDGWAGFWVDGILHILRTFAARGAPSRRVRDWRGRWWSSWGALDLVPMGDRVLTGNPYLGNPFMDASEIELTGRDRGRIVLANGFNNHGEPVRRERSQSGTVAELWFGAARLRTEAQAAAVLRRRYGAKRRR